MVAGDAPTPSRAPWPASASTVSCPPPNGALIAPTRTPHASGRRHAPAVRRAAARHRAPAAGRRPRRPPRRASDLPGGYPCRRPNRCPATRRRRSRAGGHPALPACPCPSRQNCGRRAPTHRPHPRRCPHRDPFPYPCGHGCDALIGPQGLEHDREFGALFLRVALHSPQAGADVRCEVGLVDDEQAGRGHVRAALARNVVALAAGTPLVDAEPAGPRGAAVRPPCARSGRGSGATSITKACASTRPREKVAVIPSLLGHVRGHLDRQPYPLVRGQLRACRLMVRPRGDRL